MAINYSLVPRSSNLSDDDAQWLIYAAAQSKETITLQQIARHLSSHNSPFSEGTIIGLLTDFEKCIVEHLKQGARVDLGVLGSFFTTLTGRGAVRSEDFNTSYIDRINVRWRISRDMERDMQGTPLRLIPNRAEQRKAIRKHNEMLRQDIEEDRQRRAESDD